LLHRLRRLFSTPATSGIGLPVVNIPVVIDALPVERSQNRGPRSHYRACNAPKGLSGAVAFRLSSY